MPKTIEFNTGRKYTAEGQVIKATIHDDGMVTFMDHSRGIDGEFQAIAPEVFDKVEVMSAYDGGFYKSTQRSRQDGLYHGGCNTRA